MAFSSGVIRYFVRFVTAPWCEVMDAVCNVLVIAAVTGRPNLVV